MKLVLVVFFLALCTCAYSQRQSAFLYSLEQAGTLLKENKTKESFSILNRLEKDSTKISSSDKVELFLLLSDYYRTRNKYTKSSDYLVKSLRHASRKDKLGLIYYKLGANAFNLSQYENVILYLTNVFRNGKSTEKGVLAKAETLIGLTYSVIDDYELAEKFLKRSVKTFRELGDSTGLSQSFGNLGELESKRNNLARGLYYLKKSLAYNPNSSNYDYEITLSNIGGIYIDLNELDSAKKYIDKAYLLSKNLEDKLGELICLNNLATIYQIEEDPKRSLSYYLSALKMVDEIGSKEEKKTILLNLSELYETLGDLKKSYTYFKQYTQLKDELFNKEKSEYVIETQEKYEASKRQKEIAELKIIRQKNETEKLDLKYSLIILAISVLFASLIVFVLIRFRYIKLKNKNKLELASATIDAEEKEKLRISQEIHDDLGGVLGISRMLFSKTKNILQPEHEELYQKIDNLLVHANARSRAISHELFSPTLKEFGLIAAIREQIENLKDVCPTLKVTFEAPEKLTIDKQLEVNLFRIFQELINNTMKYAKASEIQFKILKESNTLELFYTDDGIGFDPLTIKKGVGLNSIESRVHRFKGRLILSSKGVNGFSCRILIPFKSI